MSRSRKSDKGRHRSQDKWFEMRKRGKGQDESEEAERRIQEMMKTTFRTEASKQKDKADECASKMIKLFYTITVNRNGERIHLYDIIDALLQVKGVSKVFIEGSSVLYLYNKFCLGKPENELIRPGDIDLHVDFAGSWGDFTTVGGDKKDIDARQDELRARRKEIDVEKKHLMNEKNVPYDQVQKQYQPEIDAIHHENIELNAKKAAVFPPTDIAKLLDLRNPNIVLRSRSIMVPGTTVDISKTMDLGMADKGEINWKSNPQVELTVTDLIANDKYKDYIKPGFVVSDIPKLNITLGGFAGEPRFAFENVTSNYTGITLEYPPDEMPECKNFIKAFELYLRYNDISAFTEPSNNPLIKFNKLPCLQVLQNEISDWKNVGISTSSDFLCGLVTLISSKHEEDTIITMLKKLKAILIDTYKNAQSDSTESQIIQYYIAFCPPCMSTGLCEREDCGNNPHKIAEQISKILKEVFDLSPSQENHFLRQAQNIVTQLIRKDGYARGKKRRRQTRKRNKNKASKRRRNKKVKSKRNKARKTKRR